MTKTAALERLNEVMKRRHYALSTIQNYGFWVARFCDWVRAHPDAGAEPAERMQGFLTDLAKGNCAAATWRLQVKKLREEGYPDFQIAASLVHVGNEILWDVYDEEVFGDLEEDH